MAKIPLDKWKQFQSRRATDDEMRLWLLLHPNPNVAVITGMVSGIVVIDCDTLEAATAFEKMLDMPTTTVRTGRGRHFYFQHPGFTVRNATKILADVDVRGDGGYTLAPDSVHPSGCSYEWERPPWETSPAPLPERLVAILTSLNNQPDEKTTRGQTRIEGASSGGRYAGILLNYSLVALKDEVRRLHMLPLSPGNNKEQLMMASAFRMGQLIPFGYLNGELVLGELLAVWCDRWGKPLDRGMRTISRGIRDGQQQPRRLSQLSKRKRS